MKVSIVIPMYSNWQLTHNLLWDIWDCCSEWNDDLEIIVIDDASGADLSKGIKFWKPKMEGTATLKNVHIFQSKKNLGFGGNSNRGLRMAKGEIKILISTDVVIDRTKDNPDFISKICTFLKADDKQLVGA